MRNRFRPIKARQTSLKSLKHKLLDLWILKISNNYQDTQMSDQIQASHILVSHAEAYNASSKLTKLEAQKCIEDLKSKLN